MEKIFVQIASYRDPQLIPTIEDCMAKARHADRLTFGICCQYHVDDKFDDLIEFENRPNFNISYVHYNETKGACWARNKLQGFYNGEEYTLQIDSHMRFEENWDDILIDMLKDLQNKGFKKPLLTGYVSSFDPNNDPTGRVYEPWEMVFDRFIPEGAVFFLPQTISNWKELSEPIRARFYSAHFCFTIGDFVKEGSWSSFSINGEITKKQNFHEGNVVE